jgi:hypothetical protein
VQLLVEAIVDLVPLVVERRLRDHDAVGLEFGQLAIGGGDFDGCENGATVRWNHGASAALATYAIACRTRPPSSHRARASSARRNDTLQGRALRLK